MKLQQLEYVIAIAQEGSITGAAKKLYQAQPNISIALKELENKIGIQIFWRTSSGMILTPEGEEFFQRAKKIVTDMHRLEADYSSKTEKNISFKVAATRSTYITAAIGYWINRLNETKNNYNVRFMETNTHQAIEDTGIDRADIGIIRVPASQSGLYAKQLTQKNLSQRTLTEFKMKLLMKSTHPLAKYDDVPFEELKKYPEIIHGDEDLNIFRKTYINPDFVSSKNEKMIYVYDRGSKFSLLNTVENAYMWISPVPQNHFGGGDLVIKNCSYACIPTSDIVIYKKGSENETLVKSCMDSLTEFSEKLLINR
ncbi:MAG: LysR family transcriptional regulator [Ruminococcus sp.]|nr:LysR family transcriptional regulator [Ruminococcus sp.]